MVLAVFALGATGKFIAESVPQTIQVTFLKGNARYSTDNKTCSMSSRKADVLASGLSHSNRGEISMWTW